MESTPFSTVFNLTHSSSTVALTIVLLYGAFRYFQRIKELRADEKFSSDNGCQPMETELPFDWPLSLDILVKQYYALLEGKLLANHTPYLQAMPNMKTRLFGVVGYYMTDPQNIDTVVSGKFDDWVTDVRKNALFPMLGEGIFTQDGNAWKHSREILRRQFARINIRTLDTFDEQVQDLLGELEGQSGVVDLQPAFFRFTLATTTWLIFGEPIGSLPADESRKFESAFDYASLISAIKLRLADVHWLYSPRKFTRACDTVRSFARHFVTKALSSREKKGNKDFREEYGLISSLLEELQDEKLAADQLIHILIAGRDTTACTMSWAMFHLVRNPAALKRLREEIAAVLPEGEKFGRSHLQQMSYLRIVLKETLRLYPQLPVNVRSAARRTVLPRGGGKDGMAPLFVPKGTGLVYSTYHMHRRQDLYGSDADSFRPERWETGELDQIGCAYLPFHAGPRMCLGKDFALTEASYGLVSIIRAFPNLRIAPGESCEEPGQEKQDLSFVVSSAAGCKVLLT